MYGWRALGLTAVSGIAGLGYQIVWTQQYALALGQESAAVLAVVAAFFGGLCVGAGTIGARAASAREPLRWYAACEALIAVWSLALTSAMPHVSAALLQFTGLTTPASAQWAIAFLGVFLLLLPATAAMGATLPAMQSAVERCTRIERSGEVDQSTRVHAHSSLAALYAMNTAGAMVGVLLIAFELIPSWGLSRTTAFCASLNAVCALLAWFMQTPAAKSTADEWPRAVSSARSSRWVFASLALSGLLGIGYEVLVVRVLSEVAEDTVYTFALLLTVYLGASAAGAALQRRCAAWLSATVGAASWCTATALSCLAGGASLWAAERLRDGVAGVLGPGMPAALAGEATLALAAFALPALSMGGLFAQLATAAQRVMSFGTALAANTLGGTFAPLVFGVGALPLFGAKYALLAICASYLGLALVLTRALTLDDWTASAASKGGVLASRRARAVCVCAAAVVVAALVAWAPPLAFVAVPPGGRLLSYREGAAAAVSVVEDADGIARLRINNRQQEGTSATGHVDGRQGVLPVLLHPAPHHVLFLGVGTGVTASTAAQDPSLSVDAVELLPEVLAATRWFADVRADGVPLGSPHYTQADARRFVRVSARHYDVIVSDNFHPARNGSGALYTVEHFEAVRARLEPHGLFCQWLPLHQLDLETLRMITASFLVAFPDAWMLLASNSLATPVIGLVGRSDDERFDAQVLGARLTGSSTPWRAGLGFEDVYALLGGFIAGPHSLRAFAGDAPLNTDDRPRVMYRAPRVTYAPRSTSAERLSRLLDELRLSADDIITSSSPPEVGLRLEAYAAARRDFIEAGRAVRPSTDVRVMLEQVREPLLAALRKSPDFRPAYDPLLRMGMSLAAIDRDAARGLFEDLARLQPERTEAMNALDSLRR